MTVFDKGVKIGIITFPYLMNEAIAFYTIATLMIASGLAVVLLRHPIHAVLALVACLFTMAGLFVLLSAFFVAVIQILVYAGAVVVLFLFVVMLLDLSPEVIARTKQHTLMALGAGIGVILLIHLVEATKVVSPGLPQAQEAGTAANIGQLLFTTYAVPFEMASALILVGIIGAVVLAKKPKAGAS